MRFARPTAIIKRLSNGVILPLSGHVQPFPDDVLVLLMVPVIFHCLFAGKISLLGARCESSSGTIFLPGMLISVRRIPQSLKVSTVGASVGIRANSVYVTASDGIETDIEVTSRLPIWPPEKPLRAISPTRCLP
ncbi:hypothetical protein [Novosphingobium colocasiae]|uniref:hypothetical protein n=1 Tax=Novosphingobium colocasiae TaxID=1256513 RepID=UPI001673FF46|nr:hypothetical protein [Novosphingobium colocasiae]